MNNLSHNILLDKTNTLTKEIGLVLAGVVLLAISAHISIPIQPVPLTFQSTTVILIGMMFGARLGAYTICAYLAAGFSGLPVLAEVPIGPNMGYLIGFLPAAVISGILAQYGFSKTVLRSFVAACMGVSIIFLCGISVLANYIGFSNAIAGGLMPFIFTEPMKLIVVSLLIPKLYK